MAVGDYPTPGSFGWAGPLRAFIEKVMADGLALKASKSANLSDLVSAATARTNLGLGEAATKSMVQVASDPALSSAIGAQAIPKTAAISAGGYDVLGAPSAVFDGTKDVATVFGGTTAFPHRLATGSSLPFFGGGYDNHNRKYPGAANPAILSVFLGAHHSIDAAGGHGSIGGGSYHAIHGDYGTVGGGTLAVCAGTYGVVSGGRNNCAGANSKALTVTTAISVGGNSLTVGTVSGKALATGITLFIDTGVNSETFLNVTVAGSTVTLNGAETFAKAHAVGTVCYFLDPADISTDATVGGGQLNSAMGAQSTVGGGYNNLARGDACTIGGGSGNIAGTSAAANATVGGGIGNVASSAGATIAGGANNVANGTNATVAGGSLNTAGGTGSGITHGVSNTASTTYASAGGNAAVADHYGERAFASGAFSAVGDAQASEMVARCAVSGAASGELFLDQTSARITLADKTGYEFRVVTLAYARTSSATVPNTIVGRWVTEGAIYRGTGAATTTMFSNTKTTDAANTVGFDLVASADTTNGSLKLLGTCIASHSVYFVSRIMLVKVVG